MKNPSSLRPTCRKAWLTPVCFLGVGVAFAVWWTGRLGVAALLLLGVVGGVLMGVIAGVVIGVLGGAMGVIAGVIKGVAEGVGLGIVGGGAGVEGPAGVAWFVEAGDANGVMLGAGDWANTPSTLTSTAAAVTAKSRDLRFTLT